MIVHAMNFLNDQIQNSKKEDPPTALDPQSIYSSTDTRSISAPTQGASESIPDNVFNQLKVDTKNQMQRYGIIDPDDSDGVGNNTFVGQFDALYNKYTESVIGLDKGQLNTIRKEYLTSSQKKFDQVFSQLLQQRTGFQMESSGVNPGNATVNLSGDGNS